MQRATRTTTAADRPVLAAVSPHATPEEVAAIIAAVSACSEELASSTESRHPLAHWVRASRLASRQVRLRRGPWRLSGRIGRERDAPRGGSA